MSNSQQFRLDLRKIVDRTKESSHMLVRKTVIDMGTRVIERSPVGNPELWAQNDLQLMHRESYRQFESERNAQRVTAGKRPLRSKSNRSLEKMFPTRGPKGYVGGRFRANWQYATMTPPSGVIDAVDPSGESSLARLHAGLGPHPGGKIHYFVNNLPYGPRLETGWSSQAPSGMVGITVVEFQGIVDAAAQQIANRGGPSNV